MPLTLVLGPANSAKAGEVLGAFAAAAHRGALLVVPTAEDVEHYRAELAAEGAVLGSVLTFAGLADEIARRAGYRGRRIGPLARERTLRRALRGARLELLAQSAGARGFVVAAEQLIAELERALITPQRFAQATRRLAEPRTREVAAIYLAYDRELARAGRVDRDLYAWRAADALRAAPDRWGSDPVFFYGFDDLHALERDTIETLARIARVTVSLTYEAGRSALTARAEVVEALRPLAERVLELPAAREYYEHAALHHLERSLFEPGAARIDPGCAIRLLEAGGERAEAELVAGEVLALLRAGVAADQIAIVRRSLAGAAPVIEQVLRQYGVAVAISRQMRFDQTALGRSVLALARCALLEHANADDVLTYLRSPGLLERPEVADALEARVRREALATAAETLERLGFELDELAALASAEDQPAELVRRARRLLAAPRRGLARLLDGSEELDARALTAMVGAFAELEEIGERPGGAELLELLDGLAVTAGERPRPGAVLVCEPLAIRARRFRAVFVCDLQEGEFPRPGTPEPFLSDELRRDLAAAGGLRLTRHEDTLARERYLFYAAVSRATDRVFLSYQSSDEEGKLELASPFLADVADLLVEDWPERRCRRLLADVVWPAEEAPTERELQRAAAAAGAPPAGELRSPIASLEEHALRHVRHREVVSGGALEAYADCPAKWLVERQLQPVPLEPDPDPLVRGSYMHGTLEEVLRSLGRAVTPESLPEALEILRDVIPRGSSQVAPGRPPGVRRAALATIEADLRRYLEHEAEHGCDWEPLALELRFGFDDELGSLPPLRLDGVRVRGAIDRVDADPAGRSAIVRDYKSGTARPGHQGGRWSSDRTLQVPLYMLAVRELLGLEPVAGLYQPLGGGDLRARGVFDGGAGVGQGLVGNDARDPDELREALEEAAARAIALAARLRAGELEPCPQTCSRDGCRYPAICRSQ